MGAGRDSKGQPFPPQAGNSETVPRTVSPVVRDDGRRKHVQGVGLCGETPCNARSEPLDRSRLGLWRCLSPYSLK
ncbi:hypothetical protein JCM17823_28600 [Halorubrum gandharaense]